MMVFMVHMQLIRPVFLVVVALVSAGENADEIIFIPLQATQ